MPHMFHHHYALVSCIIFYAQRESIWYSILFFVGFIVIVTIFLINLLKPKIMCDEYEK